MRARYSRISSSTSSTLSFTTYLVPSTRKATVSGLPSTRSIRSGLSANRSPFRRVTRITDRSSCSMGPRWGGRVMVRWGGRVMVRGGGGVVGGGGGGGDGGVGRAGDGAGAKGGSLHSSLRLTSGFP